MTAPDTPCVCGHAADDHHTSITWEGDYIYGECLYYGFNESGGEAPIHPQDKLPFYFDKGIDRDSLICQFQSFGPATRSEDGVYRDAQGRSEKEFPWCKRPHVWVKHCYYFESKEE